MTSNINYFEWSPTKQMMVILGSNGTGKSSVMDELTPVVSDKNNFAPGGEKHFICRHKGNHYELISKYTKGTGWHSFLCNGQELNNGHTFREQEELVKQEFGLTREIHELLTGRLQFTKLKPQERRMWLTRMSVVDLTYVMEVYNKVRKEQNAQLGTVKTINKRLVSENHTTLNDSELAQLRDTKKKLNDRVNLLHTTRDKKGFRYFNNEEDAKRKLDFLIKEGHSLLREYHTLPVKDKIESYSEFTDIYNKKVNEFKSLEAVVARLVEELENLKISNPNTIDKITPEEINELKLQHEIYVQQAEFAQRAVNNYSDEFPLVNITVSGDPNGKLNELADRWITLLSSFPSNEDGWMSKETASNNLVLLKELKNKYSSMEGMFLQTIQRLTTLKECKSIICPSCTHSFKPGVSDEEVERLEQRKSKLSTAMDNTTAEIKKLEEYATQFQDYSSFVYSYVNLTKDYPEYATLWDYIAKNQIMYRTPAKYMTAALNWRDTMFKSIEAKQALESAKVLEQRLKVIAEIDQDALGYIKAKTAELENEINNKTHYIVDLTRKAANFKNVGDSIYDWQLRVEAFKNDWQEFTNQLKQTAEYFIDMAYQSEIDTVNLNLSDVHSRLIAMENHEIKIRTLEEEVRNASEVHSDLVLLEKLLSPKGGLIGKYLLGFLQGVTQLVNAYINEVWTYKLEVLPCDTDKDELDYKFPMHVAGGAVKPPDIEYGSDSQLEIVNFAFRMAMIKFMGLDDMPLYLDEFGRTFDEQHRANSIPFIARLIENGQVNQVFYISHFQSTHGAFNQAEYLVINPTNITVPEVYNKNVVLK